MTSFRILLGVIWIVIVVYTGVVISNHGFGLLAVFFGDMAAMGWPGQFNLDFMFMLALSALWVGWRHRFTPAGLLLAALAFFGGSLFLATYLLIITSRSGCDVQEILLGKSRSAKSQDTIS
ncbi:MAG: hypothetical protein FIB04_05915 [Gammaproteobacteria bacterium]|nr:hypothetical protein [Gammaproteobacteria bacterium]